jgi:hypothetical protein
MEGSRKASKVIFVMREYAKKNNVAGTQWTSSGNIGEVVYTTTTWV